MLMLEIVFMISKIIKAGEEMEKVRVLIVDDSRVSSTILEEMLKKTNFEVCATAQNTAQALEKYRECSPDIVTMDMNLPDADGIECSRRIRMFDSKAKIVMISAMKDDYLIMRGREVGISEFLQKPVEVNVLLETLMSLCQKKVHDVQKFRDSYIKIFMQVLKQSLLSLFGVESEVSLKEDKAPHLDINGVAVIIGLTGSHMGRIIVYMDEVTMHHFSNLMLGRDVMAPISDFEASDAIEEAANVIVGRSASTINDTFKDRELRITPPGTISGDQIRISNTKLTAFKVIAKTDLGNIFLDIGFSEGE